MEPTTANFTVDNVMEVLANMSEQIKVLNNIIGEQDKRIQAQALTILELQRDLVELTDDATNSVHGMTERISNFTQSTNECLNKHENTLRNLEDGLLAESTSNSEFQQYTCEFYDRVGEFNEELLNRVKIVEKHAGIVTEEHDKEAIERIFVSPKFNSQPISLGEYSRTNVENKFLKKLTDAQEEQKASTPASVVVHISARGAELKRTTPATNESSLTPEVLKAIYDLATAPSESDSDTF